MVYGSWRFNIILPCCLSNIVISQLTFHKNSVIANDSCFSNFITAYITPAYAHNSFMSCFYLYNVIHKIALTQEKIVSKLRGTIECDHCNKNML